MSLTPDLAIKDLKEYADKLGYTITPAAEKVFLEFENICKDADNPPLFEHLMLALVKKVAIFKNTILKLNGGDESIIRILEKEILESKDDLDHYSDYIHPYSLQDRRDLDFRARTIDLSFDIARRNGRNAVFDIDIVEATLTQHEEIYPIWENGNWTDKRLHTNYYTLSHISGSYHKALDVKFEAVRQELGLAPPSSFKKSPVELAPVSIRSSVLSLLQDYPDYEKNCFLIMSFDKSKLHKSIHAKLEKELKKLGINLLRADDCSYAEDTLLNVLTYIHGCMFAIAIFERINTETFNPNVSYEIGYLHAINKQVCLLKEKTLPRLPTDLIGKLYNEFDIQNLESISKEVKKWLLDKKIIKKR